MKIHYFYREKRKGNYSIELLFSHIGKKVSSVYPVAEYYFSSKNWWGKIKECRKFSSLQGDINHITGDVNFLALFLTSSRTIITVHDMGHFENMYSTRPSLKYFIYKYCWMYWPLRRVKYVTCISEYTRNKILQYIKIDPSKIKVIYNPVTEGFKYVSKTFNEECPVILCIGTAPHKNLDRLVEAVTGMSCHLMIVGILSDALQQQLASAKVSYTNVSNLQLSELIQKYQEADIVYFASLHEGFGMPIVEANSTGRPVITSNCCSMPEVAGEAACIIDPYNVNAIRKGIKRIIDDKQYRDQLIIAGLENAKRFSPDVIVKEYIDLYQSV